MLQRLTLSKSDVDQLAKGLSSDKSEKITRIATTMKFQAMAADEPAQLRDAVGFLNEFPSLEDSLREIAALRKLLCTTASLLTPAPPCASSETEHTGATVGAGSSGARVEIVGGKAGRHVHVEAGEAAPLAHLPAPFPLLPLPEWRRARARCGHVQGLLRIHGSGHELVASAGEPSGFHPPFALDSVHVDARRQLHVFLGAQLGRRLDGHVQHALHRRRLHARRCGNARSYQHHVAFVPFLSGSVFVGKRAWSSAQLDSQGKTATAFLQVAEQSPHSTHPLQQN
eukprot:3202230-Rhodomonas_salina.2